VIPAAARNFSIQLAVRAYAPDDASLRADRGARGDWHKDKHPLGWTCEDDGPMRQKQHAVVTVAAVTIGVVVAK
jgi:hypothetical protein